MTTLIQVTWSKATRHILPIWILRLVGFSSIAIAIVNLVILCCRRFPPAACQLIKKADPARTIASSSKSRVINKVIKKTSSSLAGIHQEKQTDSSLPPYARTPSAITWWIFQLKSCVKVATLVFKTKKKLTISLKNTILWNPSQDIAVANHAFNEYSIPLLSCLCQQYEVYLLIHTNNDDEYDQIQRLVASIIIGSPPLLDKSRIIYCQDEATKVRMVRYTLCPAIHVEGGCELNDGEDVIRGLQSSVDKIVWVMTRRRRASFNKDTIKLKDQDILTDGLELTDSLLDSSLAHDAGFFID